jgi:predicted  nucleic acid-binding Zn-ribbon protein
MPNVIKRIDKPGYSAQWQCIKCKKVFRTTSQAMWCQHRGGTTQFPQIHEEEEEDDDIE